MIRPKGLVVSLCTALLFCSVCWGRFIRGTITDENGAPFPGVTVKILHLLGDGPGLPSANRITDQDGGYEADVSPGTKRVSALFDGYKKEVVTFHSADNERINFTLFKLFACINSIDFHRIAIGRVGDSSFTPQLSLTNLSNKTCTGTFEVVDFNFDPSDQVRYGDFVNDGGLTSLVIPPGQSISKPLRSVDNEVFEGMASLKLEDDCKAGIDVIGTMETIVIDALGKVIDQVGLRSGTDPHDRYAIIVRRGALSEVVGAGIDTGIAIQACDLETIQLNLKLTEASGGAPTTETISVQGGMAQLVHTLLPSIPQDFSGSLELWAEDPLNKFYLVHPVNGEVPPVKGRPWKLPHYANRGKTSSSGGELASARSCFSTVRTALGKLRITGLLAQFDVARSFPQFPRPLLLQPTILTSERGTRFGIRKPPNHVPPPHLPDDPFILRFSGLSTRI